MRDHQALERKLEDVFGKDPGRQQWMDSVLEAFARQLQALPREWPIALGPPFEHTWRFFGAEIRYRTIPSDQTVEILSVAAQRPRDPYPRGKPPI